MEEFLSEDDLLTFEGWLEFKGLNPITAKPEELANEKRTFDEMRAKPNAKVGLMELGPPKPGEHLYAVAVREGADLWLTLWVTRSPKGEFFVMSPRANVAGWDPHASYHRNGRYHLKSNGRVVCWAERQPLSGVFKGAETLGAFGGHFRLPSELSATRRPLPVLSRSRPVSWGRLMVWSSLTLSSRAAAPRSRIPTKVFFGQRFSNMPCHGL